MGFPAPASAGSFLPRGGVFLLDNLGFHCRYGKNVHSRSLGILAAGRPRTAASTSATRYSDPQHTTAPSRFSSRADGDSPTAAERAAASAAATVGCTAQ